MGLRDLKSGHFQRSASDLQLTRPGFGRQACGPLGADHRVSVSQTGGKRIRVICHVSSVPRTRCVARLCAHPAAVGRQVCWGLRQSMPSSDCVE
jgi:hypothetical protein